MRTLVLGGTSFVGRHIVEAAVAAGHDVTLFNRGKTNPDLFADLEHRTGDRNAGDYESLEEGMWDAVVDVNGYYPRHVAEATAAVGDVGRYLFISTGSVYDLEGMEDDSEDARRVAPIRDTEQVTGETYGGLKVACEDDVVGRYGERATIVRPGIVAGPHDPTDRFTYWVRRLADGGDVLASRPDQPVQVVDGRDLGAFVVHLLDNDAAGIFNAVGPSAPVTFADMCQTCADAAGSSAYVEAVDQGFLEEEKVTLPLLLPADGTYDGLFCRGMDRSKAAGFLHRPLEDTARDTLAWDNDRGRPDMATVPTREREAELIAKWRART